MRYDKLRVIVDIDTAKQYKGQTVYAAETPIQLKYEVEMGVTKGVLEEVDEDSRYYDRPFIVNGERYPIIYPSCDQPVCIGDYVHIEETIRIPLRTSYLGTVIAENTDGSYKVRLFSKLPDEQLMDFYKENLTRVAIVPLDFDKMDDRDLVRHKWIKENLTGRELRVFNFVPGTPWKGNNMTGVEMFMNYTFLDGSPVGREMTV